ncbi:FIGNL1-interacting regulator of recombination and mitosis-like [Arctopsyche grandis]|uniref:FIGNL1-interacting regulator of recombination and mitosis-like n=1 Tax=Arctopsyche grandis TaxID=121162 RepID=UPI00406D985C
MDDEDIIAFDDSPFDQTAIIPIGDIFIKNIHTITDSDKRENVVNEQLVVLVKSVNQILKSIDLILNSCNHDVKTDLIFNIEQCIYILDALISFLSHIKTLSCIEVSCYKHLPKNILNILLSFFVHCKNSETIYSVHFHEIGTVITNLFKKCSQLQYLYFEVVDIMIFDLIQEDQFSTLLDVLDIIVTIGETVINLDVKTMAEQWKGYIKLSEKYADWIKDKFVHHRATTMLCKTLETYINDLTSNKTCETKDVKRWLKTSNFILKILVKITELFGSHVTRITDHFISCIILIYQNSPLNLTQSNVKPALVEAMRSHIIVGVDLLLINLLSNDYFRKNYMDAIRQLTNNQSLHFGCLFSTISIIKSLPHVDDVVRTKWMLEDSDNIFCLVFDMIDLCKMELLKDIRFELTPLSSVSFYDYIVIHTSCLAISYSNIKVIERKLLESVLNPNIWPALFACDIWPILARYGSLDLCSDQLNYLIEVYEKLHMANCLSNTPQELYISFLIRKLFKLLPKKSKLAVLDVYPIRKHLNLWRVIDFCNVGEDHFVIEIINKSSTTIKEFLLNDEITQQEFMTMMQYLKLISTIPFAALSNINKSSKLFLDNILDIWHCVILSSKLRCNLSQREATVDGSQWLIDFILLLINVTISLSHCLKNQAWITILQILSEYIENANSSIKIGILKLLKACIDCKTTDINDNTELISLIACLFEILLKDNNKTVCLIGLESFIHVSVTTINVNFITDIKISVPLMTLIQKSNIKDQYFSENAYFQNLQCNFIHKCEISQTNKLYNKDKFPNLSCRNGTEEIDKQIASQLGNIKADLLKIVTINKGLNSDHKHQLKEIKNIIDENVIESDDSM